MTTLIVVAHAGPGSTWQAMVVVAGVLLTGVLLAAAAGLLPLASPEDLVVPAAVVAIASSLGLLIDEMLSDAIGWVLPIAVVSLAAMLLAAFTPLDVRLPGPLPMGAVALAGLAAIALYQPLTVALHPPGDLLPLADDAATQIVSPAEGSDVTAGDVEVTVEVSGGSIGPGRVPLDALPADPEEAGTLIVTIEEVGDATSTSQQLVDVTWDGGCTLDAPCTRVAFDLEVPAGTHEITVEFVRGDGTPLAPFVRDRIALTAS